MGVHDPRNNGKFGVGGGVTYLSYVSSEYKA